jgi:hypothetical protein
MSIDQVNCGFGMYYEVTAEQNEYDACSILATEWGTVLPELQASLSNEARFESIYVTVDEGTPRPPGTVIFENESAGTVGSDATEPTIAVMFALQQETASAKHNGRFYVPGLASADTTGNYHTSVGGITNMTTWGSNIRQITFGADLAVFKLVIKGTQGLTDPLPGTTAWFDVLECKPKTILHGVRRRKSRVKGAVVIPALPLNQAEKDHYQALADRTYSPLQQQAGTGPC